MSGATAARPNNLARPSVEVPLAEILLIVTSTCKTCKTRFKVPQPRIMYEYTRRGKKSITRHGFSYRGLPRRTSHTSASVEACGKCFMTRRHGQTTYTPPPPRPTEPIIRPLTLEEL